MYIGFIYVASAVRITHLEDCMEIKTYLLYRLYI